MKSLTKLNATALEEKLQSVISSISVSSPTPMLHDIWMHACAAASEPGSLFEFLSVQHEETPAAACAFSRRPGVFPLLTLLGAEDIWLPTDTHYRDEVAADLLAEGLAKHGLPARFGHFPGDSAFIGALRSASRGKGLVLATNLGGAPYIRFDESWREPEKKLKSKRRSDLRRCRKKAEALGAVAFEMAAPNPDNVDCLMDEAMAVEASGWKGRSGTALAADQYLNAFFRRYARLAADRGILRLAFLRIDGRAVAVQIAAECDNAFWGFKSGYDETYRDVAPGMILFLEVVRYAANSGVATHEFLGKSAPWMRDWATDERPLVGLRYYPFNVAGAAAVTSDAFAELQSRVKRHLPLSHRSKARS